MSNEQALADLAYFAQRATFSGLEDKNLTAPGTPWIILGGSYAGIISAFTRIQYPDLFWGGLTSSGITVGLIDNWQYFDVIRRYAPAPCVEAQQQVMNLMDNVYSSGNKTAMSELKTAFNVTQASLYPDMALLLTALLGGWEQEWNTKSQPFSGEYPRQLATISYLFYHRSRLILRDAHISSFTRHSRPHASVYNALTPRLCQ